jgi:hypothetical protein
MKPLRKFLDSIEPLFSRGGRFEKLEAIYEMVDTLFYSPADVTRGSPHVRDAIDLKRVMITVVFAATPCALIGMWNVGFQANTAMGSLGIEWVEGWRGSMMALLGAGYDPASVYDNFIHGLLYFLPIYIVTMAAGGFWEVLFASVRNHEVNEGFFVTSFLYTLILPATTPLWQVALGISFGVVIGKEVFGGTGKNFLNPALVGRAFLYFAYPVQLSGDAVWVPVDGYTAATALAVRAAGQRPDLFAGVYRADGGIARRDVAGGLPVRRRDADLLADRVVAHHRQRVCRHDHTGAAVQRWRRRRQPDARDAVAMAHRGGRLRLRRGVHGHRPRERPRHHGRPHHIRTPDRRPHVGDPGHQPGVPGRHHAGDPAGQHLRAAH